MTNQTQHEVELTTIIRRSLDRSPEIDDYDIAVVVSGGTTTVSGSLGSFSERLSVRSMVASTPGVTDIVDTLTVRPFSNTLLVSDESLVDSARELLLADAAIDADRIELAVTQRVALLTGQVDTFVQRQLARHVVECVPGVNFVRNELTVVEPA